MTTSARPWLPPTAARREQQILDDGAARTPAQTAAHLQHLITRNREIHEVECINLNPATNAMNPVAEAALAAGLGSRPSLGHPGDKYEMGLEAIEEIEVLAADLACRVFGAQFAEVRVASGAMANLYAFMATCRPGDRIIAPSTEVGGHVTHHLAGVAGQYGLETHAAPVDAQRYTVDVDGLAALARRVQPRLITLGTSLNLVPHPVAEVREIADAVGADLLFDAAHACGMLAGNVWPNPLSQGADLMTSSTYKSLGGPPGGLLLTNRADLAERLDAVAYPGMTANFDAGKTAALAITLLDWLECGGAYASTMVGTAQALAAHLDAAGLPLVRTTDGFTTSHQFAFDARRWGGGHEAALRLREANILTCAIGMPGAQDMAALRLGTSEVVRWGMTASDMPELGALLVAALTDEPTAVAAAVTQLRSRFRSIHFVRD